VIFKESQTKTGKKGFQTKAWSFIYEAIPCKITKRKN